MSSSLPLLPPIDQPKPQLDRALVTTFLKNVPDAVYFKDRASRFIAMSASFVKLLGKQSEAEIIGKSDFDFFDKAYAAPAFDDEQRIMLSGESILGKLEKEVWSDGHVTWAYTSKMPLRDLKGEIIGTFGISRDVTHNKQMEATIEKKHAELMDTSRVAGKAEVATGVLHNVGNVLNSLNISASVIAAGLRQSKTDSLAKLTQLLHEHAHDLGSFLSTDPKGRRVPEFITSLAQHFGSERDRLLQELDSLQRNVDHINEIVSMQQGFAAMLGTVETLEPAALMEDALRMNSSALDRHDVQVVRDFQAVAPIVADKGKVLQILVNLISNGKYACDEGGRDDKVLRLCVAAGEPGYVHLIVQDNGIGIQPENLPKIFQHGFTTKITGHGFGVHFSALAAKEMKGSLSASSDGLGQGATFVLKLPAAKKLQKT